MRKKYTYIPKDEIESITTWNGKNITQDKILDGAYVRGNVKYAHGGMSPMAKYEVKYWETEEDRDMGESYVYGNFSSPDKAEDIATRLYNKNGFACVEVIKKDTDEVILHLSGDEYADGGMMEDGAEIYTKSVEEQAQEMLGNRFFELNPQEREDIINSFIADGVITPRVTYTQFEEEEFEYAGGGGVATASYKVIYQMVGSKDKKEKIFTDKAKAELFAETMEEDEDVKSVRLEEVVEKSAKSSKSKATPMINLFGAAKPTTTTASKKAKPTVEIDGIGDDIARYNELKAVMNNAKAEQELIGGRIKEAGLEKYIEMYEQTGRNPPNFDILSEGQSILFMVKDAYIKNISPELQEMLEEYGEGLVEVVNTYSFNTDVLEKKVKGNKTIGDIVNELIVKSTEIPQEDKMNLIVPAAEARIPKGTIDRLADYDSIEEVFNLVKPQLALK